jgi:competence protein ComEA
MVIIIYSKDQVAKFSETKEVEANVQNKCAENEEYSLVNDACYKVESSSSLNTKVSINTGSLEELMTLTGIGEAKAKDIISYREANGGFTTIEEITNVSGIGDSIFAQIKEDITV